MYEVINLNLSVIIVKKKKKDITTNIFKEILFIACYLKKWMSLKFQIFNS